MTMTKRATPAVLLAWLLMLGTPAGAAKVINESVPIDEIVFNDCTNENVHITGTAHTVGTLTENDNTFHVSAHVSFNVEGVGLTSGDTYRATANALAQENVTAEDNEIGEATVVLRALFIGKGAVPDADVFGVGHITVTPNGDTTTFFAMARITCK